jgi:hypothetical protein
MREEITMEMNLQEHDTQRVEANRVELVERIAYATREHNQVEPLEGVRLFRASAPTELAHNLSQPALAVIAQGGPVP